MERHSRRLAVNLSNQAKLRRWCEENDLTLQITNQGHHWQVMQNGFVAEWWPSSAKLVINKQWHAGIHCHDYEQAFQVIRNVFRNGSAGSGPRGQFV